MFGQWPQLAEELAHTVKVQHAILDGEIVCLKADGRSDFHALLFRREWPHFLAFDLLTLEGLDLRGEPLLARKRALRKLVPNYNSRFRYVDHVRERGRDLFALACAHDTEGVVGKWTKGGYYTDGATTSWFKVKNPAYSEMIGRHELFEERRSHRAQHRSASYRLDPAVRANRSFDR